MSTVAPQLQDVLADVELAVHQFEAEPWLWAEDFHQRSPERLRQLVAAVRDGLDREHQLQVQLAEATTQARANVDENLPGRVHDLEGALGDAIEALDQGRREGGARDRAIAALAQAFAHLRAGNYEVAGQMLNLARDGIGDLPEVPAPGLTAPRRDPGGDFDIGAWADELARHVTEQNWREVVKAAVEEVEARKSRELANHVRTEAALRQMFHALRRGDFAEMGRWLDKVREGVA